mgnify:CR=1 FL=1
MFFLTEPGKVTMKYFAVTGRPLLLKDKLLIPTSQGILAKSKDGKTQWENKVKNVSWMVADETEKESKSDEELQKEQEALNEKMEELKEEMKELEEKNEELERPKNLGDQNEEKMESRRVRHRQGGPWGRHAGTEDFRRERTIKTTFPRLLGSAEYTFRSRNAIKGPVFAT